MRVAVVGERNAAAAVRLLRSWIEDPDCGHDLLVFHRQGSGHREPDGTAFLVGLDGAWLRPAEVPVA